MQRTGDMSLNDGDHNHIEIFIIIVIKMKRISDMLQCCFHESNDDDISKF